MNTYEYNLEREEEIKDIPSKQYLKKYIKSKHTTLNKYEWYLISKNKYFTLDMVDESDYELLSWEFICSTLKLTQKELNEYVDYLNWYCVSCFQKFDIKFLRKHKDELSLDQVIKNSYLEKDVLAEAQKLYNENNDDKHYKIWRDNLKAAISFRPAMKKEKINTVVLPSMDVIPSLQKDQIKQFLDLKGVKYLYKDTLEVLRNKLIEEKNKECDEKRKESESLDAKYDEFLLDHIKRANRITEIVSAEEVKDEPNQEKVEVKKIEKQPQKQKRKIKYEDLTKDKLKKILDERKVRYLYKDTLAILIEKCRNSEK